MSRDSIRRTLVAYDVPDDQRRLRLSKVLQRFGDRIQYSVFVIDCSPAKKVRMKAEILSAIHVDEDSVLVCDLGPCSTLDAEVFSFIGQSREPTGSNGLII